ETVRKLPPGLLPPTSPTPTCAPLMQPSRTRLTCRAHNRFTPSIALWQHFIAPSQQLRRSSSAPAATQDDAGSSPQPPNSDESSQAGLGQLEAALGCTVPPKKGKQKDESRPLVRRVTTPIPTRQGAWQVNKRMASIVKNSRALWERRHESLKGPERLLARARRAANASEDYEGIIVAPMVDPKPVKESSLPWFQSRAEREALPAMDRLVLEMDRFRAYITPNRFEKLARSDLIKQVRRHALAQLPAHALEVFGSERTGLALATSDIDLRVIRPNQVTDPALAQLPPSPEERLQGMAALLKMHSRLRKASPHYMLTFIRHARYPLISLQDRRSGLDVQIVLSNDTSNSRTLIHGYMEKYPYLHTLFTVIKTIFDIRGLSDVFRGGFGSYSLFMMIVASIQQSPHPPNDAAGGLINFLRFWRDFDTTKHGISIEPAEIFDKSTVAVLTRKTAYKIEEGITKPLPPYMLCLRDPADPTNDLGRKGVAIKHVQATFRSLLRRLENDLQMKTRPTFLGPLVGPVFMLYFMRRQKLESRGRRVMQHTHMQLVDIANAVRRDMSADGAELAEEEDDIEEDGFEEASPEECNEEAGLEETGAEETGSEGTLTGGTGTEETVTEETVTEETSTEETGTEAKPVDTVANGIEHGEKQRA
ncbi:hypothetical protein J1614_011623, partial [Plenodomus biglobosus]